MINVLLKRKKFIIVVTLIFAILTATYNFLAQYNKLTMTLSLNYPNAESGLNPDGTRFDAFEIKSDEVLDSAIAKFSTTKITVDKLKDRIDIYEKASSKTSDRVKSANIAGKNFKYIPNEYTISYSQKDKFSINYTSDILKAIAQSYKEIFEKKHTEKVTPLEITQSEFEGYKRYEYVELADILANRLEEMKRYIDKLNIENASFRSSETEQTFADINVMIDNLKNIEVEKFRAFVIASSLAKDRNAYIKKLDYTINSLTDDKNKSISETNFVRGAIEKYDPNITGVAFIPSVDTNKEFYMNRTKTGLDYLTSQAYKSGINTEKIAKEIDKNLYLKSVFSKPPADAAEYARLSEMAQTMIKDFEEKTYKVQDIAVTTVKEYISYKTRDYVKFNIPSNTIINAILIIRATLAGMIGLLLACAWVLLRERLHRRGM